MWLATIIYTLIYYVYKSTVYITYMFEYIFIYIVVYSTSSTCINIHFIFYVYKLTQNTYVKKMLLLVR